MCDLCSGGVGGCRLCWWSCVVCLCNVGVAGDLLMLFSQATNSNTVWVAMIAVVWVTRSLGDLLGLLGPCGSRKAQRTNLRTKLVGWGWTFREIVWVCNGFRNNITSFCLCSTCLPGSFQRTPGSVKRIPGFFKRTPVSF